MFLCHKKLESSKNSYGSEPFYKFSSMNNRVDSSKNSYGSELGEDENKFA